MNKWDDILNKWIDKFDEIIDDYLEDAKEVGRLLKEKYEKDFSNPQLQKKYVTIASILLVITILIANIFTSFAYYYDESEGYTLIDATVGRMYIDDYDYTLLIFAESSEAEGVYELTPSIPSIGYTYNGYSCLNNSNLLYSDDNKITKTTLSEKDVCSIYFKVSR